MDDVKKRLEEVAKGSLPNLAFSLGPTHAMGTTEPQGLDAAPSAL